MARRFYKNEHEHHYVEKGWGFERWFVNKEEYCGKLLFVEKGKQFSLHYHLLKDETFVLQSGSVKLRYYLDTDLDDLAKDWETFDNVDCEEIVMKPGDSCHIPVGMRHTVFGLEDSEVFEFSTQHFDEDSYRIIKGD